MGNEMTAELRAKFNAIQREADMRANSKFEDRNGRVDANNETERTIFCRLIEKQMVDGKITSDEYRVLLGADFSVQNVAPEAIKIKDTELDKNEKKQFKTYLKQATDFESAISNIEKQFTNTKYASTIETVKMFVADINAMNINSKEDVDKIVKNLDKKYDNCDGFNKDLTRILADIAEKQQIEKEKNDLLQIYEEVKANSENVNFTNYKKEVEKAMEEKDLKNKSYYSDEAFDELMKEIKREANDYNDINRREIDGNYGRTFGDTKKQVRKELQEKAGDDDILRDVIKDDERGNILEARYNKYRATKEVLKNTTREMITDELKKSIVTKLDANYLGRFEKEDGNYDLTELQAKLKELVGDDLNLNRSKNTEVAELKHVKDLLERETGAEFNEKEIKDLIEFVGLNFEKRDRSLKTAGANALKAIVPGGLAGGIHSARLNATQTMDFGALTENDLSILKEKAPEAFGNITKNADGTYSAKMKQSLALDLTIIGALAGMAEGALINALGTLIVGEDKAFEEACFSLGYIANVLAENKDLETIQEKICEKYPGIKGSILSALAQKVHDEAKGDKEWKIAYTGKLAQISGVGSNGNCEELNGNKFNQARKIQNNNNNNQEEDHTYNTHDQAAVAPTYEDVPTIDARKSSWSKLAEQYECLDEINTEGYPLATKRKAQLPVRMLKVAQAITNGDYSAENLLKLAELTFASKNCKYENLKGIEGIDHAVLVNIMNADWLSSSVKMPKALAGCKKVEKSIIAEKANNKGAKNAPVASAGDRIKTSEGSDAKYYARFDGGAWVEYDSMALRDKAIAAFKRKFPNATVEKKTED